MSDARPASFPQPVPRAPVPPRCAAPRSPRWPAWLVLAALFTGCSPLNQPAPATAPAVFTRAENALQRGEYERAIDAYRSFLRQPTDEAYVPRAWYKVALCQYRLKDYRTALQTLDELAAGYPAKTWPQAEALRGDVHLELDNRVSALQAWAEAWRVAGEPERAALRRRFDRTIETLGETERARALELIAEPAIRDWIERPPVPPVPAAGTPAAAPGRAPAGVRIGCLLPLSGRYKEFGERSLQGIRLAFGSERDRLVVKDTSSDPEAAGAAVAELAGRTDVVAVIGPLRGEVAATVAALAESARLPLLLLAQREGLTGRYVLQAAMTRTQQAEALARQALRQSWRHVAVLAPDDRYGREFTAKFRSALEHGGGRVTWADTYDPRQRDASAPIARARERHAQGTIEAVFVPDSAAAATAIGTALRSAIPEIALLGTHEWYDPEELARAQLNGALLVTGFFPDSSRPAARLFVEAFRKQHQAVPDIFAAQAYDAAALLREVLQRGATSREAVADTLRGLEHVTGASGELRVRDGNATRALYLLRLNAGKLEEVEAGEP